LKMGAIEIRDEGVVLELLSEGRVQMWAFATRCWTFEFHKEFLIPEVRTVPLLSIAFVVDLTL
jgi:hypothetical protein